MKLFFRGLLICLSLASSNLNGQFLHVQDKSILDGAGSEVILRGAGLGGWMLQEGYMLQLASVANPQHEIKALFEETVGVENTATFYDAWLTNHCQKVDVDSLASWGFNSIRLPMHYNLFTLPIQDELVPGENTWLDKGFTMTDNLLQWCAENEIYLILDLHAAPGGQGRDGAISDYDDALPSLWEDEANKQKTIALWRKLAERYSDSPWIGGYDLINETNWGFEDPNDNNGCAEQGNVPLRELLIDITDAIREVDTNHIIYIEGNCWANNYSGLLPPWDDNMVVSFHKYWSNNDVESIQWMLAFRDEYNVPLWLGESGENSNTWYSEAIKLVEENNIGWAWWPLKKLGLNNPLEIKKTQGYQDLIDYWEGKAGAVKPEQSVAFASLMEFVENTKLENCIYHKDVIDAMIRQPYSDAAIPFKNHQVIDGYKLYGVDYDLGADNIAYHDGVVANYHGSTGSYTAWNTGWAYRNDGVDIDVCTDESTNGYAVGWTQEGEWLQYTINVVESGVYDLNIRTASQVNQNQLSIFVNDLPASQSITIPNSGGWTTWQTTQAKDIYLSAGKNVLRLNIDEGEYNFNYVEFVGPQAPSATQPELLAATVQQQNDSLILLAFNQPFKAIDGFEAISVVVNGISVELDTVYVSENHAQIISIKLAEPIVYGDFAYVSYTGSNILTANEVILSPFNDILLTNELSNPYDRNLIPGKIEAENMTVNHGFRLDVCNDDGGGLYTGWTEPNDYLLFDITVQETGTYQLTYRYAGQGGTSQFNVYLVDGENEQLLETMDLASTLGWQNWKDLIGSEFAFTKGVIQIKIEVVKGSFNINYVDFKLMSVPEESNLRFINGHSNTTGDTLFLNFNKPLLASSVSSDGFLLLINGETQQFESIALESSKTLVVKLENLLGEDDIVKMAYGAGGTVVSESQEVLAEFGYQLINNETIELNLLAIPGKIEAEDYSDNNGFEFEACSDTGGGTNWAYTDEGDYLDFDVNVEIEGKYDVLYRVAAESATGELSLQKVTNGNAQTINSITFSATGGWQNWTTIEDQVTLDLGVQKLRLLATGSLYNLNWVEFKKASDQVTGLLEEVQIGIRVYPNPTSNQFVVRFQKSIINSDQIRICNLSGQFVDFEILKINEYEFRIKHKLKPGLYIMSMSSDDKYISRKLIVE